MRHQAIYNTHSNVVTINGDSQAWDKDGKVVELDENKIEAEVARLQAEYDAQEYARNRATAYDSVGNQLDLLFHDMTAGKGSKTGEWYKAVAKVKSDNPKPE